MFLDNEFLNNFNQFANNAFSEPAIINKINSPADFLRIYLKISTNLDDKSLDVLIYMLNKVNENGIYEGTYNELIEDMEISRGTLATIMTKLQQMNLIFKHKLGWLVNDNITSIPKNTNIVIRFNSKSTSNKKDKSENNIDSNQFNKFMDKYLDSYKNTSEQKDIDCETLKKDLNNLISDYQKTEKEKDFHDYLQINGKMKEKEKEFAVNAVKLYQKENDKNKNFEADFESSNFSKTKENYFNLFDKLTADFTGESKALIKGVLLAVLNIANETGSCEFQRIKTMLINREYARKILMEAPMVIKSKDKSEYKLLEYFRFYERYLEKLTDTYSQIYTILMLFDDEVSIVKYKEL